MKRFTFFVMISLLLVSLSASAQQPLPPPMAPEQVNELMAQARASGKVRVIVEFAVPNVARSASERERGDAIKIARLGLLSNVRSGAAQLVANSETWTIPYAALEVDAAALQALAATPGVLAIGPDAIEYRHLESALPLIDIDDAHARGTTTSYGGLTGEGWTVVVLDDGIQANHAFFGGRIVHEACFSNDVTSVDDPDPDKDIYGSKSLCPNGQETQFGSGAAATTVCGTACDHGTHVMGIAIGNNGANLKGAAPGANGIMINIMAQGRDLNNNPEPGNIFTYVSDQVAGLEYVKNTLRYEYKIASINMSLGAGQFFTACDTGDIAQQPRIDAINQLTAAGIAVVISSGNSQYKNAVSRPGCISNAITVASVDDNLAVSWFSNVSQLVDFLAPGANIYSSVPAANGNYATMSGTSMAAPMVAGAWAVLKQAAPNASVGEIESALTVTGTPIDDNRTGGVFADIPLIQVDEAIDLLRPAINMVYNGDMETAGEPGVPEGWARTGASKRVCNRPDKTHTIFGNCAAKMLAAVGTKSQIKQNLDLPRGVYDDQIDLSAQVKAKNLVNGRIILKVTYVTGDMVKKKILLHESAPTYDWTLQQTSPLVLNETVAAMQVIARVYPGGKFWIDDISVALDTVPVDND